MLWRVPFLSLFHMCYGGCPFFPLVSDLQLAQSEDPHGMRGPHPHASMPVLSDDELSSDSESDTDPDIPSGT